MCLLKFQRTFILGTFDLSISGYLCQQMALRLVLFIFYAKLTFECAIRAVI